MIAALEGAEFNAQPISISKAQQLTAQGQSLLDQANALAS